ncbi:NEIL3, partial [Symbiodinium pilosum]
AGKSTWIAVNGPAESETAVFFDDLLYTPRHRSQFLQNLEKYEIAVPVEIVAIERDFEAALASNLERVADRQVPIEAMQKFRDSYVRPGYSAAEALRQMQEEASSNLPDRRSEGDPNWLANGAQVELHSLQKAQALNGQRGAIVGFDDKQLRYRVKLHSDATTKVVAKKNLRLLTLEDLQPAPAPPGALQMMQHGGSTGSGAAVSQPSEVVPAGQRITREMVLRAADRVKADAAALQQRIAARRAGGGNEAATADICDVYLRLTASEESFREVKDLYQAQNGRDEDLELLGNAALENVEVVAEQYFEVRSWQEYFQDEVNVTKYSVKKHGILGTLKNEVVEVGNDVKDLGRGAATVVQSGRDQMPHLVRAATDTMGTVVQSGSAAAASTAGTFAARSQEHITTAVHDTVVAPVKRAWHLMATGFILCVLVPLFALRTYAPLNSVVSNLGILWLGICTCCPPRGMNGRAGKAALLLLYPLITVVLPLALHYWATHPELGRDVSDAFRRLPEQFSRLPEQLEKLSGCQEVLNLIRIINFFPKCAQLYWPVNRISTVVDNLALAFEEVRNCVSKASRKVQLQIDADGRKGRFLQANCALKAGEVILSERPLFEGNTLGGRSQKVYSEEFLEKQLSPINYAKDFGMDELPDFEECFHPRSPLIDCVAGVLLCKKRARNEALNQENREAAKIQLNKLCSLCRSPSQEEANHRECAQDLWDALQEDFQGLTSLEELTYILQILSSNRFGYSEQSMELMFAGSMFEHSCLPNCFLGTWQTKDGDAGTRTYRALRDIEAGEALSIDYLNFPAGYCPAAARAKALQGWGFSCTCPRCVSLPEVERCFVCPACGEPQLCPRHPSSSELLCLSCGKAPEEEYAARCMEREAKLAQSASRSGPGSPAADEDVLQAALGEVEGDQEESLLGFHHYVVFQALWQEVEQGLPEPADLPAFQQILKALIESISTVCRRKEHPAMLNFYHMAALSTHEDLEVQKKYLEHEHCI